MWDPDHVREFPTQQIYSFFSNVCEIHFLFVCLIQKYFIFIFKNYENTWVCVIVHMTVVSAEARRWSQMPWSQT